MGGPAGRDQVAYGSPSDRRRIAARSPGGRRRGDGRGDGEEARRHREGVPEAARSRPRWAGRPRRASPDWGWPGEAPCTAPKPLERVTSRGPAGGSPPQWGSPGPFRGTSAGRTDGFRPSGSSVLTEPFVRRARRGALFGVRTGVRRYGDGSMGLLDQRAFSTSGPSRPAGLLDQWAGRSVGRRVSALAKTGAGAGRPVSPPHDNRSTAGVFCPRRGKPGCSGAGPGSPPCRWVRRHRSAGSAALAGQG